MNSAKIFTGWLLGGTLIFNWTTVFAIQSTENIFWGYY